MQRRSPAKAGKTTARPKKPISGKRTAKASAPAQPKGADQTLEFRNRQPADDPYILQLTEEQLGKVHQESFHEPFPRDQFMRYLQSGAPTVLIERGKKRVGYYSYLVSPDAKMHISAMVIDPAHQSDGIGTSVMQRLEDDARKHGVQVLEVFVQTNNEKSLAFTRKLGFHEVFQVTPGTICLQKRIAGDPAAQTPPLYGGEFMPPVANPAYYG